METGMPIRISISLDIQNSLAMDIKSAVNFHDVLKTLKKTTALHHLFILFKPT
ncbi:hypothetical protein CF65_00313 [Aggregatibacter actinomycetemcomitans HK1651]|nr:hypothetical protein CF65_00313 [Aggregatibacter actinomycetemcomitans HK1651]